MENNVEFALQDRHLIYLEKVVVGGGSGGEKRHTT